MLELHSLIQNHFIQPQINSTIKQLMVILDEYEISHIPIFDKKNLTGMASKELIENLDENETIESSRNGFQPFFISDQNSLFDAIGLVSKYNTNIIPVLDNQEKYLGYITEHDLLNQLSKNYFITEPASLIVVSVGIKQYSISEISKIVESNNGRISAIFVTKIFGDRVQIAIKFNASNLTSVGETFERFGYSIDNKFFNDNKKDMIKDRYQQLMRYLNL